MNIFTEKDLQYLSEKGIEKQRVLNQIQTFQVGIEPVRLGRAAMVGDGILRLSAAQQQRLSELYREQNKGLEIVKFIPASGAASRMFKALFSFLNEFDPKRDSLQLYMENISGPDVKTFYEGYRKLPFYQLIRSRLEGGSESGRVDLYEFVAEMLTEKGLNYGFYPKGLLPFHNYDGQLTTPFEEHLKEAAAYARSADRARLHFTISPQHKALFEKESDRVTGKMGAITECSFDISYSFQKESTDTLAVTPENNPFRDGEGRLLFRPGGHGALLENLNEQEADLLFIKNIDNVVTEDALEEISEWKEVLGGHLLEIQQQAHYFARILEQGIVDHELMKRVEVFLENSLNVRLPDSFSGYNIEERIRMLKDKLARPIRVCGMVRNEGDPGGGPFWIRDNQGRESLQIVESAQVHMEDSAQKGIFEKATHFNPVDLVCGVRDAFGQKFNLMNYQEPKQGFITEKTYEGKPLKALELPGLWNGGMAYWNTVFIEVPGITFNPVKTVNDLLKPAHQTSM